MLKKYLLLALLAGALTGCGSDDSNNFSPSQTATLRIGVIAPINGGLTAFGRGILDSVQLAVNQANARGTLPGYRLEVTAQDDSSDPARGAPAAQALVADPSVIGVVGTYNSGVAAQALPVLAQANLVMISPGNTDPSLTHQNGQRPFGNYFRLVIPDSIQGPELARYAFNTLGFRRAAVVNESKSVSAGLANDFITAFTALGGTVVFRQSVPDATTDYSQVVPQVMAAQPDLLFFGGEFPSAAALRDQATAAGLKTPLMGGDGIKDQSYITQAGPASEGDYASSVGAPADRLPGGAQFLADYQAAGFADPPSDFGPYAYDAANLIVQAAVLNAQSRAAVVSAIQAAHTQGVTGPIAFDSFGDTTNRVLTFYQVATGVFAPRQVVTLP